MNYTINIKSEEGWEDNFALNDKFVAYDDQGNVYDVYTSEESHQFFGARGRIKAIMSKDNEVLSTVYPLFSPEKPYSIIEKEKLSFYNKIFEKLQAHEK